MRLALVAPFVSAIADPSRVPPLGGAQVVLSALAMGLAARGHAVTLLGARGSELPGVGIPDLGVDSTSLRPAQFDGGGRGDEAGQVEAFRAVRRWLDEHAAELDVVHAHAFDAPAFDALGGCRVPVAHTLHLGPVGDEIVMAVRRAVGQAALWTVSNATAAAWNAAGVRVDAVVPNGVPVDQIPFGAEAGGYLLIPGRVSPEKGVHTAIDIAAVTGWPLLIAGGVYDRGYYDQRIAPRVRDASAEQAQEPMPGPAYVGPRSRAELFRLMSRAFATLLPVEWDEPFGLTAVEAQAAGSPVIGYRRGAMPEVVAEGQTGFLVEPGDLKGLVGGIADVDRIDRSACRAWVAERFDVATMLRRHEALYAELAPFP